MGCTFRRTSLCQLVLSWVSWSRVAFARVVINELSPAGTPYGPCEGLEFFELLNLGDSSVNLSGHELTVQLDTPCRHSYIPFWTPYYYVYLYFEYEYTGYEDYEDNMADVDEGAENLICLTVPEAFYYVFQEVGSDELLLRPGERRVQCVPKDIERGAKYPHTPLVWHAIQFGWPLTVGLRDAEYTLLDRTDRLPTLPSSRFEFQAPMQTCREVLLNVSLSELNADLSGLAWARVPDGTGGVTAVGRATPGEANTNCLLGDVCTDCPPPSAYQPQHRRCVCPAGTWLSSKEPFQCTSCEPGRFSDQIDTHACKTCPPGQGTGLGQASCEFCPLHTFSAGGTACSPCPAGLLTISEGARSMSSCVCAKGSYLDSEGKCSSCRWPYSSEAPGATSVDDCIMDLRNLMPHILCLCGLIVIAVCVAAYLRLRKYENKQKEKRMRLDLTQGLAAIQAPQYPLCLVSLIDFCNMTEEELGSCHEGARDAGQLLCLDSKKSIDGFKSLGHKILFFSYTWPSWEKLGPNKIQADCMKAAAERICAENQLDPEHFFVWLDILGIPQANTCCKALAVHSLYVYASSADFLVVICPPCLHAQTGDVVDAASYKSRVWCRVEQMAHCLTHGFESMYISAENGRLEKVTELWMNDALHIFDGEVTCCRLRHPEGKVCDKKLLVPSVLAMYADMLAKVAADGTVSGPEDLQIVWDMICKGRSRVFPQHFSYVNEKGKRSNKVLFGDTIDWVHKLAEREELNVGADVGRETSIDKTSSVTTVDLDSSFRFAGQAVSQQMRLVHGVSVQRADSGAETPMFAVESQQQLRRRESKILAEAIGKIHSIPENNITVELDDDLEIRSAFSV
eukprot:TRINITY_DN9405_c0_g3_i1.p1 TRINITY_DN9405_c0_g3~~TRINITY_DN9405_c0_g3_i1.p1  ORF type:complete len:851 (-),score=76.90 TRINITY_DN9405_c0_g3_i1:235-2787(-)